MSECMSNKMLEGMSAEWSIFSDRLSEFIFTGMSEFMSDMSNRIDESMSD